MYNNVSGEKEGADATAEVDKTDGDGDNTKDKVKKPTLKEGWQTRILHHHDKIIRAKNHSAANQTTQGAQTSATSSGCAPPSSTTGGGVSTNNAAIPPPELISALRHIFGSVSSSDLQELLENDNNNKAAGKGGSANKRGKGEGRDGVNTLPSLLSTVLNHSVFKGTSSTLPTAAATTDDDETTALLGSSSRKGNVKRDWKSMFDVTNDDNNKEGAKQEGEDEDRVESFGSDRATIDNSDISPDKHCQYYFNNNNTSYNNNNSTTNKTISSKLRINNR